MLDDIYNEKYKQVREQWIVNYFSWVDSKTITEAEFHTARDGFDAGANWKEKDLSRPEHLIRIIEKLSEEDRLLILKTIQR